MLITQAPLRGEISLCSCNLNALVTVSHIGISTLNYPSYLYNTDSNYVSLKMPKTSC